MSKPLMEFQFLVSTDVRAVIAGYWGWELAVINKTTITGLSSSVFLKMRQWIPWEQSPPLRHQSSFAFGSIS